MCMLAEANYLCMKTFFKKKLLVEQRLIKAVNHRVLRFSPFLSLFPSVRTFSYLSETFRRNGNIHAFAISHIFTLACRNSSLIRHLWGELLCICMLSCHSIDTARLSKA